MRNIAGKKQAVQEEVDSDYLFANLLQLGPLVQHLLLYSSLRSQDDRISHLRPVACLQFSANNVVSGPATISLSTLTLLCKSQTTILIPLPAYNLHQSNMIQ